MGLINRHFQSILCQSFRQHIIEALRVALKFKGTDKIVSITAEINLAFAMHLNLFFKPHIQRIMEIQVGKERGNYAIDTKDNFEFERQIEFDRSNSLVDMRRKRQ